MSNGDPSDIRLDGGDVIVDGVLKLDNIEGKTDEYIKIKEARIDRASVGVLTGDFGNSRDELLCKARRLILFNPKTDETKKSAPQAPGSDPLRSSDEGVTIEAIHGLKISGKIEVDGMIVVESGHTMVDLVALVFQLQQEVADLKKKIGS